MNSKEMSAEDGMSFNSQMLISPRWIMFSPFVGLYTLLFSFLFIPSAFAFEVQSQVEIGLGKLKGNTVYEIGGTTRVPGTISELEFPLDVNMLTCRAQIGLGDAWFLSASYAVNLSDDAGKMRDSDWGYWRLNEFSWASSTSLDIYSESDAEVDARILNLKARFSPILYQKEQWLLRMSCGLGYLREKFVYDVSDLDQWYPSYAQYEDDILNEPFSRISLEDRASLAGHDYVSGLVLTYEVTYDILYFEIGANVELYDALSLSMNIGYSPFVSADDYDNHILRSKISMGDCDGDAFMREIAISYIFMQNCRLSLAYNMLKIDTSGTQHQYSSDGTAVINQDITSRQNSISLRFGLIF